MKPTIGNYSLLTVGNKPKKAGKKTKGG